jgi:virginiamycin B lyase
MRTLLCLLLIGLGVPASATAAGTVNPVEIEEWAVPYEDSRPRDPDVAKDGAVWFVGQRGDYLARFDPATGDFARHDLEEDEGPHNLIVGDDGAVWYAGNRKGNIGRFDPDTGEIERIVMPDPAARDPHTLVFDHDQSHIWFTVQGGNFVGRLTVADGTVDLIPVPTAGARPYGIVVAPDGTPWIALFGTNKLASVDPATLTLTEHALPDPGARPRRLEVTGDGVLYYTDYARGFLGRFDAGPAPCRNGPCPRAAAPGLTAWRSTAAAACGSSRPGLAPTPSSASTRRRTPSSRWRRFRPVRARSATWSMTRRPPPCGSGRTPTPWAAPRSWRSEGGRLPRRLAGGEPCPGVSRRRALGRGRR